MVDRHYLDWLEIVSVTEYVMSHDARLTCSLCRRLKSVCVCVCVCVCVNGQSEKNPLATQRTILPAQLLKAPAVLAGDLGLVPGTPIWWLKLAWNSSLGDLWTFFSLHRNRQACGTPTYGTHTCKNKYNPGFHGFIFARHS